MTHLDYFKIRVVGILWEVAGTATARRCFKGARFAIGGAETSSSATVVNIW